MRATRAHPADKNNSKDADAPDEDEVAKPKFTFGSDNVAKDSTGPFKFNFGSTGASESTQPFGKVFTGEAKMFANKNLFANPMLKAP